MPTINTFQDPRFQAIADFLSVAQIDRMQAERERREEREQQQQRLIMGVAAGAGALAAPALGLGAQVGSTMAGAPIMGATLGGTLQGAAFGAQAGAQFAGGDIAGGIGTVAGGIGQGIQRRQDIQQFGFAPTALDKKEISKLALSLGTTTRAFTASKPPGIPLGQYAAQVAQQQDQQRQSDAFFANMGSQLGVDPALFEQIGEGDPQAGVERVRGMREKERLAFQEKQLDQRLSQTELFKGMSETHDLRPAPDGAQQALRYRNAVLSPASGVDAKQRLELLNRIVEDAENQPAELQWVRKPPPSPQDHVKGLVPVFDEFTAQGFEVRASVGNDNKTTFSVTRPTDTGEVTPKDFFEMLTRHNIQQSKAIFQDVPLEQTAASLRSAAEIAGIQLPAAPQADPQVQQPPQQQQPAPPDPAQQLAVASAKLSAAIQQSPNVDEWTPELIEETRREALFIVRAFKNGAQFSEEQEQVLAIAIQILEK